MTPIYMRVRERARQLVTTFPTPDFYQVFPSLHDLSHRFLRSNPMLIRLRSHVGGTIQNDFGHGLRHAHKVTCDAGALLLIEGFAAGYSETFLLRRLLVVQIAGLLHDIQRRRPDHAQRGADYALRLLQDYPLDPEEIEDVAEAIRNHEAFKPVIFPETPSGMLISGCLYDADKFRWGPDNFQDTVWDMVAASGLSLSEFVQRYPRGMEYLARIQTTFRTPTGKTYGPQSIDIGLAVGAQLLDIIKAEFAEYL
jgi:hypothetical protein